MSATVPSRPILEVLSPGLQASVQDAGRTGWRRFGVPAGGAMDDHAAATANALVGNPASAPVLELLLQGARLRALSDVALAVTGADASANVSLWEPLQVAAGQVIEFPRNRSGVWTYVAVAGGFDCPRWLGSASVSARAGIGRVLAAGDILRQTPGAVASSTGRVGAARRRDYLAAPALRVWPGPQWELFSEAARADFFERAWTISSQSDRVGYRLTGEPLAAPAVQLLSEPMLPGTIQVPENGLPIVTLRDGPTVGGYPKLGLLDPADLSWLVQCRPGQSVRFQAAS